jgi:hypothetical protein
MSHPFTYSPQNKVLLLLIIEEKYREIWTVQDEHSPGFIIIKNTFHTATHQHEKQ